MSEKHPRMPNISELLRSHVPDAVRTLVELMRTGDKTTKARAARAVRKHMTAVREVLPEDADTIAREAAEILKRRL